MRGWPARRWSNRHKVATNSCSRCRVGNSGRSTKKLPSPISGEDALVCLPHLRRCGGFVAAWFAADLSAPRPVSAVYSINGSRLAPADPVQLRRHPVAQRSLRFSDTGRGSHRNTRRARRAMKLGRWSTRVLGDLFDEESATARGRSRRRPAKINPRPPRPPLPEPIKMAAEQLSRALRRADPA